MAAQVIRAAIVGASTLLGKELAEELNGSTSAVWDLSLLEAGEASGLVAAAGDEAMLIQAIEPTSFAGKDVVFFAADEDTTRRYWKAAQAAGACVVDMSGALEKEQGVLVRAPWIVAASAEALPDLGTQAVVPAHPAAVMLCLVLSRLRSQWKSARLVATVLQPASEQGSAGLDEMHQQTVSLLAFQPLPQDVFDAQVAFNLNAEVGAAAKLDLTSITGTIRRHVEAIAGLEVAQALALQLLQAPVFHGYTASAFLEIAESVELAEVERALQDGPVSVLAADDVPPSNLSATEQGQVLVRLRAELGLTRTISGFWAWMAADNLRLAARNAAACAIELLGLRPMGKVQ